MGGSLETWKEQLNKALISLVASACELNVASWAVDDDSVDLTIGRKGGGGTIKSPRLDLQLKCSEQALLREDGVHIQLKRKNYDDLRETNLMVPKILVVFLIPSDLQNRLVCKIEEGLTVCKYAWWTSLKGAEEKKDIVSPTVTLPRNNYFDPDGVTSILRKIEEGLEL